MSGQRLLALCFSTLFLSLFGFSAAQPVTWRDVPVDTTQTLSLNLPFGSEARLITKIAAADLDLRALATHSLTLADGTVMAAILQTQPEVTFANSGGAYARWQGNARTFQSLGLIEEDDYVITLALPAVDGADFIPNVKIELVLRPILPTADGETFLSIATLSDDVKGAQDYGLSDLQWATAYPEVDIAAMVTLRDLPQLSMARQGGRCQNASLVRTVYARVSDLQGGLENLDNFPQECWRAKADGLRLADIEGDPTYQPNIRVRLAENGGEVVGFVFGAAAGDPETVFVQNTSRGWLYTTGDGSWTRISNGSWEPVAFANGTLVIRNPRGGETADATENDAFVSYLLD